MGAPKFNKVVVVDVEATCWENKEAQGDKPSEIIEIGVCVLDAESLVISRKNSYIVRPKFSEITKFCTQLTGHTWNDVKTGMPFSDACNKLAKEYGTKNKVWASWGDYDRNQFQRECKAKEAKYPFGGTHINASALFSLMMGEKQRINVADALEKIDLKFEGRPHRGDDDAYNIAVILRHMLKSLRD